MALSGYLLDTSVHHRASNQDVLNAIEARGVDRLLYRCAVTELEVLRSAISPDHYRKERARLAGGYVDLPISPAVMSRAIDTQASLAEKSQHRGVSLADLIIAACAAANNAAVLHYDEDYERIAQVTGQPVEWVVPAGSVD